MQKALLPHQLFVNTSSQAESAEWVCFDKRNSRSIVADIRDVPGPCGAQNLHQDPEAELPTVFSLSVPSF